MVKHWRFAAITAFVVLLLTGLLAADLFNRGLVWQFFWSQTGEEQPLAQVRGMVEWVGNLTRSQPINDPLIPVDHANVNPYGINTFLHQEVDPAKVDEQLRLIADAGFGWIREEFTWEEIEVDGRGQFTDSRNDMDGDGTRDTISGWAKFDRIVDLAEKHGIRIQARLSNPPAWSQSEGVHTQTPPANTQDYVNFITAAAERYRGRVTHFQIWNEPNIFPEWGADGPEETPRPVNPEAYTALLCASYEALKAVDPDIVVISGALAPTSELGTRNLNDFVFLERMYEAGAGQCFDVLSMQGYGLNSGPTDRRMRSTNVNFGRSQYIRDLMVKKGDSSKPIWISEAAWNPVPTESDYPEPISNRYIFGQVTLTQAAQYMPMAYQRMEHEWPWVAVMNYWYFTQPSDLNKGSSWYYFRMAEPDYSDQHPTYTTLPIYASMKAYIQQNAPTLYQGVHQLDGHWAVAVDNAAEAVKIEGAQFDEALQASSLDFVYSGTDLLLRWRGGRVSVSIDGGEPFIVETEAGQWQTTPVFETVQSGVRNVSLTSVDGSPFVIDAAVVMDQPFRKLLPLWAGLAASGTVVVTVLLTIAHQRNNKKALP